MPRAPRELQAGYCYHVAVRCNNRAFRLSDRACRDVLRYTLKRALLKYRFKLSALWIMTNHGHYLLEPAQPGDLPPIMHRLTWYTAMYFNQLLKRTGHSREKRYSSAGLPARGPPTCPQPARLYPRQSTGGRYSSWPFRGFQQRGCGGAPPIAQAT
jgi:REP-associated tyrosine transposase